MREEGEVFDRIPEGACSEHEDEQGEEDESSSASVSQCEVEEEEHGKGGEEKDGYLSADGSERVRQALAGQILRSEHHEEDDEEEGVSCEVGIPYPGSDPFAQEPECLSEQEEKSGEEERADDRIEDGIGRVIMSEILIADEIVFDEREPESFRESEGKIAVIDCRREDGDLIGS